tara:strand:+ start:266 stop:667 length:402 start_codon:yes stop_codon:yes gene_type:complete
MSEQISREDKHKLYLRDVVMRQTDYNAEQATEKLKEFNYNVVTVIKDYMGINIQKKEAPIKSINQQIYGEIRGMMDEAASKYRIKKEIEKKQEQLLEQRRIFNERIRKFHLAAYKIQCYYRNYYKKKIVEISI